MGNKVSFGLTNVYYSKITTTGEVDTYCNPVRIHEAQEFSSEVIAELLNTSKNAIVMGLK